MDHNLYKDPIFEHESRFIAALLNTHTSRKKTHKHCFYDDLKIIRSCVVDVVFLHTIILAVMSHGPSGTKMRSIALLSGD